MNKNFLKIGFFFVILFSVGVVLPAIMFHSPAVGSNKTAAQVKLEREVSRLSSSQLEKLLDLLTPNGVVSKRTTTTDIITTGKHLSDDSDIIEKVASDLQKIAGTRLFYFSKNMFGNVGRRRSDIFQGLDGLIIIQPNTFGAGIGWAWVDISIFQDMKFHQSRLHKSLHFRRTELNNPNTVCAIDLSYKSKNKPFVAVFENNKGFEFSEVGRQSVIYYCALYVIQKAMGLNVNLPNYFELSSEKYEKLTDIARGYIFDGKELPIDFLNILSIRLLYSDYIDNGMRKEELREKLFS